MGSCCFWPGKISKPLVKGNVGEPLMHPLIKGSTVPRLTARSGRAEEARRGVWPRGSCGSLESSPLEVDLTSFGSGVDHTQTQL